MYHYRQHFFLRQIEKLDSLEKIFEVVMKIVEIRISLGLFLTTDFIVVLRVIRKKFHSEESTTKYSVTFTRTFTCIIVILLLELAV